MRPRGGMHFFRWYCFFLCGNHADLIGSGIVPWKNKKKKRPDWTLYVMVAVCYHAVLLPGIQQQHSISILLCVEPGCLMDPAGG